MTINPESTIIDLSKQFFNHSRGECMSQLERMANEAVYTLQLNSRDALRYIQRNAGVNEKTAAETLKSVVEWAKTRK